MNPQITTLDSQLSELLTLKKKLSKVTLFWARLKNVRYVFWLNRLRNVAILKTLLDNYDKIPPDTPTKLIIGLFKKSSKMRSLLLKREAKLRKKIY